MPTSKSPVHNWATTRRSQVDLSQEEGKLDAETLADLNAGPGPMTLTDARSDDSLASDENADDFMQSYQDTESMQDVYDELELADEQTKGVK
jgi:hypothetical protein